MEVLVQNDNSPQTLLDFFRLRSYVSPVRNFRPISALYTASYIPPHFGDLYCGTLCLDVYEYTDEAHADVVFFQQARGASATSSARATRAEHVRYTCRARALCEAGKESVRVGCVWQEWEHAVCLLMTIQTIYDCT